jgi:methionyl-tRNA synthetase
LVRTGNKYIDEQEPWTLYKQKQQAAVEEILYAVLESVRLAAYLLSPVVPQLSTKIYQQLGLAVNFEDRDTIGEKAPYSVHACWGILPANQPIEKPQPVFRRLE